MNTTIPYRIIADCFRDGTVIPFLGSAASFVGAEHGCELPNGSEFSRSLAELGEYPGQDSDQLMKVAQYLEEIQGDRPYLLNKITSQFLSGLRADYRTAATEFLQSIPPELLPRLILTTNYDVLVERTLESNNIRYIAISHILKGSKFAGRLFCYDSLSNPGPTSGIFTLHQLEDKLFANDSASVQPIVVYKMHGSACLRHSDGIVDSIVITENDYVDFFAQDLFSKIPARIVDQLRTCRLLFFGYSLSDWNFRVLLRKLQMIRRSETASVQRHWAFLRDPGEVEMRFWEKRGVNVYDASLTDVFTSLLKQIRGEV